VDRVEGAPVPFLPGRRKRKRVFVLAAVLLSFGVIFVAELGVKSQLMALAFATRYRAVPVLIGITIATALVHLISVVIGGVLGAALPTSWITLAAGIAFLGFAAWTLRGDQLSSDEAGRADRSTRSAVVAASAAFFLAELGDKTMLATITLATTQGLVGTWIGSTAGMVAADALAILVGQQLAKRVSEKVIRYAAAASFVVFGALLVAEAIHKLV
jgi:putative Ca2+/H+ antiporter (TMEM165/GDT1 family)